MNVRYFWLLFLLPLQGSFSAREVVHHPAPKQPIYIHADWYGTLKNSLPLPPQPGSDAQKKDETELFAYQKNRKPEDCIAAKSEVLVSLDSFFGGKESPFSPNEIQRWTPFFEQVRNDADYFVQKLKVDFPRLRPFLYLKGLEPCVAREVTKAYPSGHAVLSRLFALILRDLSPQHRAFLDMRAQQIGDHRVLAGMHHRTDVETGRKLAELVYEQLKKSSSFQKDFELATKKQGE